jgi:hypothetical protein
LFVLKWLARRKVAIYSKAIKHRNFYFMNVSSEGTELDEIEGGKRRKKELIKMNLKESFFT